MESCLMLQNFHLGWWKSSGDSWRRLLHNNVNELNATELHDKYNENGKFYVMYISSQLKKKNETDKEEEELCFGSWEALDKSQKTNLADQEKWVPSRWRESSEAKAGSKPLKAQ